MEYVVTTQAEYDKAKPKQGDTVYLDSNAPFKIKGSARPILVTREKWQPTIYTWDSSQPTIYTWGSSQPTISTWGSSQPTISTWGSSQPTIKDHRVKAEPDVTERTLGQIMADMRRHLDEFDALLRDTGLRS